MFDSLLNAILLIEAQRNTILGDHSNSIVLLEKLPPKYKVLGKYNYLMAINKHSLNNKDCIKYAYAIKDSFVDLPTRYYILAEYIIEDALRWQEEDLGDIRRDMKISSNRLHIPKADRQTKNIQEIVLNKLDKLIKEKEDALKNAIPIEEKASNSAPTPAQDSVLVPDAGKGEALDKTLKTYVEKWGQMPEKQRAKVIMEISRQYPAKYRLLIENFFKALSSTSPHKDK